MPVEIKLLLNGLALRERVLVLLAGSTGLRQSELFWSEVGRYKLCPKHDERDPIYRVRCCRALQN